MGNPASAKRASAASRRLRTNHSRRRHYRPARQQQPRPDLRPETFSQDYSHSLTFYPTDELALFIDGANLYSAAKGWASCSTIASCWKSSRKRGVLVRAYYYTALVEDQEYSPIRPLVDWLDYNGFRLVTKPAREYTDAQGASAGAATWTSRSPST